MPQDNITHTLPIGYVLHNEYVIESVIGQGGFGITYRAHFCNSDSNNSYVAIKEYYPSGIAARKINADNPYYVTHFDGKMAVSFRKGIARFRQEAYLLKQFDNLESIVTVTDIFDENNTTYIVMEYIEGITLQKLIDNEGSLPYSELITLLLPLFKDLERVHENGLIHRDISPDNLLIGTDNKIHLIDFGSANHNNINESRTFTVILKAGYAPPEQYSPKGKLGAWTDVYGCCATMYFALTGHAPMDSLQRMQPENADNDTVMKASLSTLKPQVRSALMTGLTLSYKERFPSMSMLINALESSANTDNIKTEMFDTTKESKKKAAILPMLALILIGCIVVFFVFNNRYDIIKPSTNSTTDTINSTNDSKQEDDVQTTEENANTSRQTTSEVTEQSTDNTEILTMVNMIGKSLEQATTQLNNLDSSINILTIEDYSKTYPKGTIIAQSIQSNTQFTKGNISSITLTISLGEKPEEKNAQSTNSASGNNNSNKKTKNNDGYTTIHIGD